MRLARGARAGPDPLDGIDCYESTSFGVPHWHYVSYGHTELYAKESRNRDVSGWGCELTMRVRRGPEEQPPTWPIGLLQNLARYTFETGRVFETGTAFDPNGFIALGEKTALTALVFAGDPELGDIVVTRNGRFQFVQVVGITGDELDAAHAWSPRGLSSLLGPAAGNVTDLRRGTGLGSPATRAALAEGIERDGSSTGVLRVHALGLELVPALANTS